MALISAFQDEHGSWHGDPNADTDAAAQRATMVVPQHTSEHGAQSPFAGQRVGVLFAPMEGTSGPVAYQLDSGRWMYSTREVYQLLGACTPSTTMVTPPAPVPASPLAVELCEDNTCYQLVIELGDNTEKPTQMHVDILGSDHDGQRHTWLDGYIPSDEDELARIGRLFLAAATARLPRKPGGESTTVSAQATRRGTWHPEEVDLLTAMYQNNTDIATIAAELGRTERAVRFKLYQKGMGPFPDSRVAPAEPKPPPAYTMADLRRVHPNSHKPWTPEDDAALAQRAREGATVDQLTAEFGRNRNAIIARLAKIGCGDAASAT